MYNNSNTNTIIYKIHDTHNFNSISVLFSTWIHEKEKKTEQTRNIVFFFISNIYKCLVIFINFMSKLKVIRLCMYLQNQRGGKRDKTKSQLMPPCKRRIRLDFFLNDIFYFVIPSHSPVYSLECVLNFY